MCLAVACRLQGRGTDRAWCAGEAGGASSPSRQSLTPASTKSVNAGSEVAIEHGHNQERDDAQAQKRKLIGRSPKVFQHGSCLRSQMVFELRWGPENAWPEMDPPGRLMVPVRRPAMPHNEGRSWSTRCDGVIPGCATRSRFGASVPGIAGDRQDARPAHSCYYG